MADRGDPRAHGHATDAELEDCWRGLARMAAARRTAGVTLSAYDRQALDRYPPEDSCTGP